MWKNDHWKRVVLNIFLVLLIAAILGGLGFFMLRVRSQNREYDEHLSELYVQQQQQQTEARQESVAAIQAEYEKDLETVAKYLPGIVCWGDSLTQGTAGNTSYPSVLKAYLETYFSDIYSFRRTISNAEDFARLNWDDYTVSVPVVNMGASKESSFTILGRAGAVPYVLSEAAVIPAGTEPVEVRITSQNGEWVRPLIGGAEGINNLHIAGIEGELSLDSAARALGVNKYLFTRTEEGEETRVEAGEAIETAGANMYRDYIHIVCIGTFGSFDTADELVDQVKALLARQTENTDRYIVLGIIGQDGTEYSAPWMDIIDSVMMQAFGNRYINIRKYLIEDGLSDAGLKATDMDTYNISIQKVPASFISNTSEVELNARAYKLIGKLIYDRMDSLGYFDEVYEELGIRDRFKQLLKEDSGYFDRNLNNRLK